jgi:hypothetical protein
MDSTTIQFEEIQADIGELVQQIGMPGAERNGELPFSLSVELRKLQIKRLEENIGLLRRKQEEFHRRMENYVGSLKKLIDSLQQGLTRDLREQKDKDSEAASDCATVKIQGTVVRCVGCGAEKKFPEVNVLVALEPDEFLTRPTEVIVQDDGQLKKGFFKCPRCGDCNLTIKPAARS